MSLNIDSLIVDAKALEDTAGRVLIALTALTVKYESQKVDYDKLQADNVSQAELIAKLQAASTVDTDALAGKVDAVKAVIDATQSKLEAAVPAE